MPSLLATRWIGKRGTRILHTGAWSMIAKLSAAANVFLTVPFVLHSLGPTQFGVWATLVSLVAFAGFLDFGLGNGTMNLVAAAHGRGDGTSIGTIVREAHRTLVVVATLLACLIATVLPLAPWHLLLGIPGSMESSARMSVAIVLFTIAIAVPLNLANRVQLGMGQGDRAFRWQAIGQGFTACVVILLARADVGLELLVAATVSTPLITSAANNWQLWRDPSLVTRSGKPRDPAIASAIRNEGVLFFVLQLAAALAFSADLPLISAMRGPDDAGNYAIVQRLFSVIPMGLGLIWTPLWPVYRQALAAGDNSWVLRTLKRSLLGGVGLAMAGASMLALAFDEVISIWVAHPMMASGWLVAGFSVWCVADAAGTAIATLLNAASVMRYQIVVAISFATVCVAIKAIVISHFGIALVPWVTVTTYSLISLLPTAIFLPRLLARISSRPY